MANYATLKAAINQYITTNGNNEITGAILNNILDAMVDSLGANYGLGGVATPSTNPGTPDQNVFYLAFDAGTYTNFNNTVLPAGISTLMWNGSWTAQTWYTIDAKPTYNSNNFVKSGGVYEELALGAVYDVTAHNSGATFASLSALLSNANLNTLIPTSVRKGGMSIKFVQSNDNNYVQYRLMADAWSTTVSDWQGVDDVPTAGSDNLVKSGGVSDALKKVSEISKEYVEAPENEIEIKDDGGNTIVKVSSSGVDAKNLKINGVDVATKIEELSEEEVSSIEEDEVVFYDSNNQEVAKIKREGICAKAYLDLNGNPLHMTSVFLPPIIYVAVGRIIEIYNNTIIPFLNADEYSFAYSATNNGTSIGIVYPNKFRVEGLSSNVGTYNLSLNVYDNQRNRVASTTSIIKVVAKNNELQSIKALVVGDSLCNKPWLPETCLLFKEMYGTDILTWMGTLNYNTSWLYQHPEHEPFVSMCHNEGRSGWTAGYYLGAGASFSQIILNVSGISIVPANKKKFLIPNEEGGSQYYEIEECLDANGDVIAQGEDGSSVVKIKMNSVDASGHAQNNWRTPIGAASGYTINAVDTSMVGDNTITYTSWYSNADNPFYDKINQQVDVPLYLQNNNMQVPDVVVTMLGMNGHNATDLVNLAKLFRTQLPNTKVIVMIPHFVGSILTDYSYKQSIYRFNVEVVEGLVNEEGIYICPVFCCHDSINNMCGEQNANPRCSTFKEKYVIDAVHPQYSGYMQFADLIFSTLLSEI